MGEDISRTHLRLGGRFGPCQSLFSFCDVSLIINMLTQLTHHLLMTRVKLLVGFTGTGSRLTSADPGKVPLTKSVGSWLVCRWWNLMITPQWCKDFKTNRMINDDSINTNRDWTQQMWLLSNNNYYFPIDVSTCFNISQSADLLGFFCFPKIATHTLWLFNIAMV